MENQQIVKYGIFWVPDDPSIADFFLGWKNRARELEPDAPYVDHPVHATLFLFMGSAVSQPAFLDRIALFCKSQKRIDIRFDKWHIFKNDVLTGGNTLTANIVLSASLLKLQENLSTIANPFRTGSLVYEHQWAGSYRTSYERYGFPFVGDHWLPHITIGSFSSGGRLLIEEATLTDILPESTSVNGLSVYKIDGEQHECIRMFNFTG